MGDESARWRERWVEAHERTGVRALRCKINAHRCNNRASILVHFMIQNNVHQFSLVLVNNLLLPKPTLIIAERSGAIPSRHHCTRFNRRLQSCTPPTENSSVSQRKGDIKGRASIECIYIENCVLPEMQQRLASACPACALQRHGHRWSGWSSAGSTL